MAAWSFHEAAEPVNEGEVEVLRRLRDELSDGWFVIGNFEFPAPGGRWYECDALALHESGYGYLIETKAWTGQIQGNDKSWLLPSLTGRGVSSRQPPIHVLTTKLKKLVSALKNLEPLSHGFKLEPVVVLVSDEAPDLAGKSAETTVLVDAMVPYLEQDPRTEAQRASANVAPEAAHAIHDRLCEATRPPSTNVFGAFELVDRLELRQDGVETWIAHPVADPGIDCILKRYPIDALAPPDRRDEQLQLARRHHTVLGDLDDVDVVPLWGAPLEIDGDFVVVSRRPDGSSLRMLIDAGELEPRAVDQLVRDMFRVLARIHARKVIHRWIRPGSVWVSRDWKVKYSDFDVARVSGLPGVTGIVDPDQVDLEYSAPEVIADLAAASTQSDVYSVAAVAREAYGGSLDSADPRIAALLEQCLDQWAANRPADAGEAARALTGAPLPIQLFDPHDVIDDRFVVRSRHESGGLTVVYRLFDNMLRKEFGGKFVRPKYQDLLDAAEEWRLLEHVPPHPNLAKPTYVLQMRTLRRREAEVDFPATFLLTPWIDGRSLDQYIDQALPWRRIFQIGRDVALGLAHLHDHEVLHRDIKPENVLIRDDLRAVILDFNVSTPDQLSSTTSLGTEPYRAPEIADSGWSRSSDVFSLGVCLVELLAGTRLGKENALGWLDDNLELWGDAQDCLRELLDENPQARPRAAEVAERFEGLAESPLSGRVEVGDPPELTPGRSSNPYVDRLRSYFSQSSVSNAGTRGLDRFAEWFYVDTKIDRTLRTRVLAGELSLVVITGNAGDGKTAFIREFERDLVQSGATRTSARAGNGSEVTLGNHVWVTNWDGSQDEGEVDNDTVLSQFLAEFSGDEPSPTAGRSAVIAINEGRLVDFLSKEHQEFSGLSRIVDDAFAGHADPPPWMAVVNLNKRVLTRSADGRDVVAELLTRMSDPRLWVDCNSCPANEVCPSYANAGVLRDPTMGPRAKERIREVLDVVRLRRRLHITTRDLLSVLAYTVVGNTPCEEVVELDESARAEFVLKGQLYNRFFAAADDVRDGATEDRLLREIAQLDVSDTPHPELDGRLWLLGTEALAADQVGSEREDRRILEILRSGDEFDRFNAHTALRRKLFFEREEPDYVQLLPYGNLRRFQIALRGVPDGLIAEIASAISASEGLRRDEPELAVRLVADIDSLDRSFVRRRLDEFELSVVDESESVSYVEYAPDLLRLTDRTDPSLALDIDVDVFEALMRMNGGFTPSREDLRGSWLSLATFKERLASMPSRELLLQSRTGDLTQISMAEHGAVAAEPVR